MSQSQQSNLPDYLTSTLVMIQCAFPGGLPSDEYKLLIALLYPHMSQRGLARVLAYFLVEDYSKTQWDVYDVVLGGGYPDNQDVINRVEVKLKACGYDEWIAEDDY